MSVKHNTPPTIMSEEKDSTNENNLEPHIKNLMRSLNPLWITENLMGIFRFTFNKGELSPPNWRGKCYSLFFILIIIVLYGFDLKLSTALTGDRTYILVDTIEEIPSIVVIFQFISTSIVSAFLLSKSNIKIVKSFAEIDQQLLKRSARSANKDRVKHMRILLLIILGHVGILLLQWLTTVMEATILSVIILIIYVVQKIEVFVFCTLINLLKSRLVTINEYLSKFILEKEKLSTSVFTICKGKFKTQEIMNFIGRPSRDNMKIRDLAIIYDMIGILCGLINTVFNFQIFMTLVSTFVYIVITIWASLYYYKTPENHYSMLIVTTAWCTTIVLVVVVMCLVCEQLRMVRNHTKILVNQIIIDYDLPKTMRVQAKAFMELIDSWPLQVLVYDMFSVDISLMLKYISVSTTYLIVIIQISHFV